MANNSEKQIVKEFLFHYFNTDKSRYKKEDIPQYNSLVEIGVLCESISDSELLEIVINSPKLQSIVLEISEDKLTKNLPLDVSEAFKFIDDFQEILKKEYKAKFANSYDTIIEGFKTYILTILFKQNIDVRGFVLSLNNEDKRENHLFNFERSFFDFLPYSNYSEKEIFEICEELKGNEYVEHDIITFFRDSPKKNLNFGKKLLDYGLKNSVNKRYISDLLIGLYNAGDLSAIDRAIKLKDENFNDCLFILGRLNYRTEKDTLNAFNQIGELEFENIEIAYQQSYLIRNIIECEHTTETIRKNAYKLYVTFLNNGTEEVMHRVFQDVYFINGYEADKYKLLHLYLSKTGNFKIIKDFFFHFEDPAYIFDIMMRLFNSTPNYRFSTSLFENGIRQGWNSNQVETEQHILNLFKQHPAFGILGVKVIFTAYLGIFQVDLLKLDKVEYQINAIDSICKHPHSFDKLLPLILPLRNSKYKGVREHLQKHLAKKVFSSYHGTLYNQIESIIGKNKKDKQFIEPIKKALDDYKELKRLKESINDLNPYENEQDLMDLYYRLEHEAQAKMMNEVNAGKGTFMESFKNVAIVRGNSWMIREGEVSPLWKHESSMLIDGNSYLNPDLYEHNLNLT